MDTSGAVLMCVFFPNSSFSSLVDSNKHAPNQPHISSKSRKTLLESFRSRKYTDVPLVYQKHGPYFAPWVSLEICSSVVRNRPEMIPVVTTRYLDLATRYRTKQSHFVGIDIGSDGWVLLGYTIRERALLGQVSAKAQVLISNETNWKKSGHTVICLPHQGNLQIFPSRPWPHETVVVCAFPNRLWLTYDTEDAYAVRAGEPLLLVTDLTIDKLVETEEDIQHIRNAVRVLQAR